MFLRCKVRRKDGKQHRYWSVVENTRTARGREAHVFSAFLAYCLHVTLARRLHALAPGLTARSVLEKFAAMQMIDVHLPTHRRPRAVAHPLYRARTRAQPVAGETQTGAARSTAPQDHRWACAADPAVVPTFGGRLQRSQILTPSKVLESAKLG